MTSQNILPSPNSPNMPDGSVLQERMDALVMKGGGVKGLAFAGALQEIERYYTFDTYVGTSAGAIAAVLLTCGYTGRELEDLLRGKNFRDFLDGLTWRGGLNLLRDHGLNTGDHLQEWLSGLIKQKMGDPNITVEGLCSTSKRLILYASGAHRGTITFDSEGKHKTAPAAFAARCSMAIPYFFSPKEIHGLAVYDGGLLNNYPVEIYVNQYLEKCPGNTPSFIALYLGVEPPCAPKRKSPFFEVLKIVQERNDPDMIDKYRQSTIFIDPSPINTLNFSLSGREKDFLVLQGRVEALRYLKNIGVPDFDVERYNALLDQVRELKEKIVKSRRRKRWFRSLIIVSIALFAWWYASQYSFDTAPNNNLDGLSRHQAEIALHNSTNQVSRVATPKSIAVQPTPSPTPEIIDSPHEFSVDEGGSSTPDFDGPVIVSITTIREEGDPPHLKVHGSLGTATSKAVLFKSIDVGSLIDYGEYKVKVLSIDFNSAKFIVTKTKTSAIGKAKVRKHTSSNQVT